MGERRLEVAFAYSQAAAVSLRRGRDEYVVPFGDSSGLSPVARQSHRVGLFCGGPDPTLLELAKLDFHRPRPVSAPRVGCSRPPLLPLDFRPPSDFGFSFDSAGSVVIPFFLKRRVPAGRIGLGRLAQVVSGCQRSAGFRFPGLGFVCPLSFPLPLLLYTLTCFMTRGKNPTIAASCGVFCCFSRPALLRLPLRRALALQRIRTYEAARVSEIPVALARRYADV